MNPKEDVLFETIEQFFCTGATVKKAFSRKVARWGIPYPWRQSFEMKPDPKDLDTYTHYDRVKNHQDKFELLSYSIVPVKVMSLPGLCEKIHLSGKRIDENHKVKRIRNDFEYYNRLTWGDDYFINEKRVKRTLSRRCRF